MLVPHASAIRPPAPAGALQLSIVTETWPPEVNGVALTLSRLVDELLARGHRVQLLRPRQGLTDTAADAPGLCTLRLPGCPVPGYPQLRMGLPAGQMLQQVWTRERPDLVHIATEGPLGWSALRTARRLGIAVTSDFRTHFPSYSRHYGLGWLDGAVSAYLRHFHNQTLCTMVPTQALRDALDAQGVQRLQVVARGVDTARFDPARRDEALRVRWGAGPQDTVVLVVGRLAPEKNLSLALRSFAAMKRVAPRLRMVFVGDGPLRQSLQAQCPAALFTGAQSHGELAVSYASADLLLFPSLTETFGNVTLEALASGLPVLAFDHAAAAEHLQDGVNGWRVAPGDAKTFVQTAERLAGQPGWLAGARSAARASVAGLAWPQVAARVESVLRSAIDASSASAAAHGREARVRRLAFPGVRGKASP